MKLVMNATREAVLKVLKGATEPMTLNEIANAMGVEKVNTGTTNAMVANGVIRKVGTKRVPRVTYVEVATYEMGEEPTAEAEKEGH